MFLFTRFCRSDLNAEDSAGLVDALEVRFFSWYVGDLGEKGAFIIGFDVFFMLLLDLQDKLQIVEEERETLSPIVKKRVEVLRVIQVGSFFVELNVDFVLFLPQLGAFLS